MTSFYEELHNTNKISDEKENAQSRANVDKWIFRMFLFLLGFMPLVVMANVKDVISPLLTNIDILSSGTKGDLFTYYKALIVFIITVLAGGMLLVKILFMGGTIRKTWLNYILGLFVVALVVSTISSSNITIALTGHYNRSDGAISWLSYITLLFIAMNISYPKNVIKYVMYTMMPFIYINLYIILMNFYGKDLLQFNQVQSLISLFLPEGASISEGSSLVGTLNQWNYMSGMFAMMTVMYLAWAITSRKIIEVIIGSVSASVAIAIMFMSVSTSGFLTILMTLPLLLIFAIRVEKRKFAGIALAIFVIISAPIFHVLANKDASIWTESFGFFTENNPYVDDIVSILDVKGNTAHASEQNFKLPILPERALGTGSGRFYIWDKTLDLVKDNALLGYGMDSIMYNFPHYNIDARASLWDENTIVDKPHNLYIGILYGCGIFGLLAVIILVGFVTIKIAKAFKQKKLESIVLGFTVWAFFVQAMFNDSLVGTTAIAFIFIGMTLVVNDSAEKESIN